MELSYLMKIRIVAAMAVGILLLGVGGWYLVGPADSNAAFALITGSVTLTDIAACGLLAFLAGLIAFFVCAPFGVHIGPVAAPAGLAVWAIRTAPMAGLLQSCDTISQRSEVYKAMAVEGFLWLTIIACGLAAVYLAQRLAGKKGDSAEDEQTQKPSVYRYLRIPAAIILSVIIACICMNIFAQDVKMPDARLGWVIGQPAVGQIAFAVIVAFAAAGFFAKAVLGVHYIWPTASTAIASLYIMVTSASSKDVPALVSSWSASFFLSPLGSILPIQIVAFGSLGAFGGYWLGVRYLYWRKHKV